MNTYQESGDKPAGDNDDAESDSTEDVQIVTGDEDASALEWTVDYLQQDNGAVATDYLTTNGQAGNTMAGENFGYQGGLGGMPHMDWNTTPELASMMMQMPWGNNQNIMGMTSVCVLFSVF